MHNLEIENCLINIDHLIVYELNEQFEILSIIENELTPPLILPLLQFALDRSKEKVRYLYSLKVDEKPTTILWKI